MAIEIGHVLKMARTQQGLSLEDVCKKMGTRVAQIQALELGNDVYFKNGTQPFIWFARLYAKKLGVDLASLQNNNSRSTHGPMAGARPNFPEFLLKKSTCSSNG